MKRLGSFGIKLIFTSGKVCLIISAVLALSHSTYFSLHCFSLILQGSRVISIPIHSISQIVFFFSKRNVWKCLHRGCSAELILGWGGMRVGLCLFPSQTSGDNICKSVSGAFSETLTAFNGVFVNSVIHWSSQLLRVSWRKCTHGMIQHYIEIQKHTQHPNFYGNTTNFWKGLLAQVMHLAAFGRAGWLGISSRTDFCHLHESLFISSSKDHCFSRI